MYLTAEQAVVKQIMLLVGALQRLRLARNPPLVSARQQSYDQLQHLLHAPK